ncbi:hypothetical protein [Parapedobacter sp. 10938]|uniref:hypothetical protein n=1 Tax=Parapedobacter flavus TaxID=3110225 RepID=UPI002DB6ABFD|nr:hypothetical protein [Parapedobacter sp. 10938]MEC3881195.1 hypothetical protein [Parapedobacter sp. 10938]
MNIKNSFLVAASLFVLGSCARHPGEAVRRGTLYNNETNVDSEGYTFFKRVNEKAQFETQLAKYVRTTAASAEAKDLAGKVVETYEPMVAELSDFAAGFSVVLVDRGELGFAVPHHFEADTLGAFDNAGYIAHVQHEQGAILDQFKRLSRNTIEELQHYAEEKMPTVKALYVAAGGQEDHGAHH